VAKVWLRDELTLPDNTSVYSYDKAREIFDEIEPIQISVSDAVLMLLYSQHDKPVNGRVSMMKQIFLLVNEVLKELDVQDPKFVPNRYGMYSFNVTETLTNLEFARFIDREGKKNTRLERFKITDKGIKYIAPAFDKLPKKLQVTISEKRKGWDQLGYDGILRYVYQKYPKFRDKSVLKNRYAPIFWGRSKG
jgi:uncharacterized protein YwgA